MDSRRKVLPAARLVLLVVMLSGLIASPALGQQPEKVKVLIGFNHQPGAAEHSLVHRFGGTIKYTYHLVPAIAATVPEPAIAGLRANPNVTHVELDGEVYAMDAELDNAWGVSHIGAGLVHDGGNKGADVRVAVIDSGIDYNHPDLDANYVDGKGFVNGDTDPMDDNGHGTHVAGTIAAEDNDVGVVGVAPEADLYALKVLDETGWGLWSDVIAAIEWSVDPNDNGDTSDRMDVINMSLGGAGNSVLEVACQKAYDAGILLVASAGNSGNRGGGGDNVGDPAGYASVIAVAATDSNDNRASFSSTGPDVELAAPGVNINSTLMGGGYQDGWNGTSMASPHVAGTAALVLAANPDWSNDQVRARLQTTADDLGDPGRDTKYGFGLVDADEAAGQVNSPPTVSITSPADDSTFDSGTTILFEGRASDPEDGDLTASLVWTSSIDGEISTGGSFFATPSDGNHTITASVTDSGGKAGSASISITVGTPPSEPTTVSVSTIAYATNGGRDGKKHLSVTIALVDDLEDPVSGASVSIDLYHDGSLYASGTGTTGTDGTVTFKVASAPSGDYTTIVTDVTAEGLTWDGVTPGNGFTKE